MTGDRLVDGSARHELSDRYSGRVDSSLPATPRNQGGEAPKGDECLPDRSSLPEPTAVCGLGVRRPRPRRRIMSDQRRISQRQLEQLQARLSERDMLVLTSLRRWRLLQPIHLCRLHFVEHASAESAERICRRTMQRLASHNLVRALERRIGGQRAGSSGTIWALAPTGWRILGEPTRKRWHEPGGTHIAHTLAIAELGTRLWQGAVVRVEHGLLNGWTIQPEPDAWRRFNQGHQRTGPSRVLPPCPVGDHRQATPRPTTRRRAQRRPLPTGPAPRRIN